MMTTKKEDDPYPVGGSLHPALHRKGQAKAGLGFEANVFVAYALTLLLGNWIWHRLGGSFENASTMDKIYYISSIVEAFGLLSLLLKISKDRSVAGLSGRTMIVYGCEYFMRTTCVPWSQLDLKHLKTLSFEFLDVLALVMALRILYCVFWKHRDTYQREEDTFPVQYQILACSLLPMLLEADMRMGPWNNYIWNVCLYMEMTALLPQVFMIGKAGVGVEALVSHFVAATACSRMLDVVYWYSAFSLIGPVDGGFNFSGWLVVLAHVAHGFLLADFMYYYLKFRVKDGGGLMSAMPEDALVAMV